MTYTDVRSLELGDKIKPAAGPMAAVAQITDNYVRLEWYKPGTGQADILSKLSPLWATLERVA